MQKSIVTIRGEPQRSVSIGPATFADNTIRLRSNDNSFVNATNHFPESDSGKSGPFIRRATFSALCSILTSSMLLAASGTVYAQSPQDAFMFHAIKSLNVDRTTDSIVANIDESQLEPGATYLVAQRQTLANNITNTYLPVQNTVFTYDWDPFDGTISIPKLASPAGFPILVNWDNYMGAYVNITSLSDNTTVSGTISLSASITDVFTVQSVRLYVDGSLYQTITNGPANFTIDTTEIPNGSHQLDLSVLGSPLFLSYGYYTNDDMEVTVYTNAFEPTYTASLTNLMTSNPFAADYIPQNATTSLGPVAYEFETTVPATCTIQIKNASGALIRTLAFTNAAAGPFPAYWDQNDGSGNPVPIPGTYNLVATAYSLQPSGQAHPNDSGSLGNPISFATTLQSALYAAQTGVFRSSIKLTLSGIDTQDQNDAQGISDLINSVQFGITAGYEVGLGGFSRLPFFPSPFVFQQNGDLQTCYNALTNISVGHIVYIGYASPGGFGFGPYSVITANIEADTVSDMLGNKADASALGKRLRYTEIDGGQSADGYLPQVFGTPNVTTWNPSLAPSAFCGWSGAVSTSGIWFPDTPQERHYKWLHWYWMDFNDYTTGTAPGPGIRVAANNDISELNPGNASVINSLRIIGAQTLQWIDRVIY